MRSAVTLTAFIIRRVRYDPEAPGERYAEFDQTGFPAFHRFGLHSEDTSAIKALVASPQAANLSS